MPRAHHGTKRTRLTQTQPRRSVKSLPHGSVSTFWFWAEAEAAATAAVTVAAATVAAATDMR